jgi:hypothetical protein
MFVHVVNFYLKAGLLPEDIKFFEENVKALGSIESLVTYNVGKPADTNRPTIDRSYTYCELAVFNDKAGHDFYQTAPAHLEFVEKCKHLWEKVVIFDSETI